MAKKTLHDVFVDALLARGSTVVKRLKGCTVMSRVGDTFYYVGSSGSVRYGATRTSSIPVSDKFKDQLKEGISDVARTIAG